MELGGEYRFKAIWPERDVAEAARELGVDQDWALARIRTLAAQVPDALASAAVDAGLGDDPMAVDLRDGVAAHIRTRLPR